MWVGLEYESLLGDRAIVTPAQLAACVASSLDPVLVHSETGDGSSTAVAVAGAPAQQQPQHHCPLTDALADAAAEVAGAAAAAAAAARMAAAAAAAAAGGGGGGTAPPAAVGGPAAEFMLSTTLPLYLHASADELGGTALRPEVPG